HHAAGAPRGLRRPREDDAPRNGSEGPGQSGSEAGGPPIEEKGVEWMAHDVARSRREPGGNPRRSVALPEEGVVVHVRGWIGPRAEAAGGVQARMVQVEADLGDEGGVQESPGQVPSAVEGTE